MNQNARNGRPSSWELPAVALAAWVAFAAIPLTLGEIGLSWDALNHHIYLGWTASGERFGQDFMAAAYQTYQFPYLYWPVYMLSTTTLSGAWVGVVLGTLHVAAVPPVWMIAKTFMPDGGWFDTSMRVLAVMLAFMSGVVLSLFDSTSNDLLAATPLIWSIALAVRAWEDPRRERGSHDLRVLLSGLLAGAAVAFKLSNGPLAVLMPVLWLAMPANAPERLRNAALGCVAAAVGFIVCYVYWGWQMWVHLGNPLYPFLDHWFEPVRLAFGWAR